MSARRAAHRLAGMVVVMLATLFVAASPARAQSRVGDLTAHPGEVPRRIVGYGLVVGLDGTGDRSFGGASGRTPTVRSVINLLRRFSVEIPEDRLRLRNVAAVLVTAEVSPYLRRGGRFEVQISALGDATSLRGGVLWITPLVLDPDQPPVATAQGAIYIEAESSGRARYGQQDNSGRIPTGGLIEVDLPAPAMQPRLLLREPDLGTAQRIALALDATFGPGTAKLDDAGALSLTPQGGADLLTFMAAVDTVEVRTHSRARVVIDARHGSIVAGGDIRVETAVISHRGITLQIGGTAPAGGATAPGLVRVAAQTSVQDVAAGLHAAGARPDEIATIFESLRAAGALQADLLIR